MILALSRADNGKSLSVKGFYTEKYKEKWIIKEGAGIPQELGYDLLYKLTMANLKNCHRTPHNDADKDCATGMSSMIINTNTVDQ